VRDAEDAEDNKYDPDEGVKWEPVLSLLALLAQKSCFTGTKVQILTLHMGNLLQPMYFTRPQQLLLY